MEPLPPFDYPKNSEVRKPLFALPHFTLIKSKAKVINKSVLFAIEL